MWNIENQISKNQNHDTSTKLGLQRCCKATQGEIRRAKHSWSFICLLPLRTIKNAVLNIWADEGGHRRILILYEMWGKCREGKDEVLSACLPESSSVRILRFLDFGVLQGQLRVIFFLHSITVLCILTVFLRCRCYDVSTIIQCFQILQFYDSQNHRIGRDLRDRRVQPPY